MSMKRILSTFLAILMLLGSVTLLINAEETSTEEVVYEYNTGKATPTMNYFTGEYVKKNTDGTETTLKITTKKQKLETMDFRLEANGYRMYVDAYSGEVAVECIATGEILFTNPYDLSSQPLLQEDKRAEMLSQIIVSFVDTSNNNQPATYNSYKHCVKGGDYKNNAYNDNSETNNKVPSQINVKYIRDGIRVEYSIGRVDSRYLVPERISKENFETLIKNVAIEAGCTAHEKRLLNSFFELKDLDAQLAKFKTEEKKAEEREKFLKLYPMAEKGPVYALSATVTKKELKTLESIIKKYCPDYTYEMLDEEHLKLNYTPADKNEALFKIALEYTVDATGLKVRLPASGIRFDESIYRLESIEILPYMGAGRNPNAGYTFFPDGSGALFDFQDLANKKGDTYFYGSVYGDDFAYYNIASGSPHNETVRYPVYGLVETEVDEDQNEKTRGYLAIVEEGDAMMKLFSYHSTTYNTVRMQVNPRPYDSYKLSSLISAAGNNDVWTVVSPRKYTGSFTIRYIMLTDEQIATGEGYYEPSYVGMAKAYREYLERNGVLTRLTEDDVKENIPLYIETFGAIETTEKFLSIPYDTMKPLTSFGDIKTMYDQLSSQGVDNINFILTGYTKGGLSLDRIPYNLKWDSSVKKDMSFEELVSEAKKNNFGVYPDFDFVFSGTDQLFDGLSRSNHAVKTIDGRYTSKREYSATRQTYVSYFELAISPAFFSRFYKKLTENYLKYEPVGISVSTLGKYLNSDFDEDDPYHREDSEAYTKEAFRYLDEHYDKVLTSGGNSYSWKYVDYITDISTDSSRHGRSSATVPFLGMVLHGYVQTAGTAVNMEGNIDYAILRAIENGASLKFILSYRKENVAKLKNYERTSDYYSVRYDIWVDDLVERYSEINAVLKDVQTSTIDEHMFLDGMRILNSDEIELEAAAELEAMLNSAIDEAFSEKEELRSTLQAIRKYAEEIDNYFPKTTDPDNPADPTAKLTTAYADKNVAGYMNALIKACEDYETRVIEFKKAAEAYKAEETESTYNNYNSAKVNLATSKKTLKDAYDRYIKEVSGKLQEAKTVLEKYEFARDNFDMLYENNAYSIDIIDGIWELIEANKANYEALNAKMTEILSDIAANLDYIESKYSDIFNPAQEEAEEEYNKYKAATNSIVYERYENGKAMLLNFNSYAVKVEFDGVVYTLDAYGYVILN